jgi:hypothetical protein
VTILRHVGNNGGSGFLLSLNAESIIKMLHVVTTGTFMIFFWILCACLSEKSKTPSSIPSTISCFHADSYTPVLIQ